MATRSNIAYKTPEGKIRSIYSHWDGYPEHNGELLRRFYTTQDKVEALVALGSISSLGQDIGEQVDFDNRDTHTETVLLLITETVESSFPSKSMMTFQVGLLIWRSMPTYGMVRSGL